ncbi:WXG100 family type VII secretion target [Corynebacterium sp. TAE3-ERU12]|uniref:WXG100 family type VII secretion target n=1 Tax=Corynebacterium sp. TAE3-ERU12 TaxID=2849491 RepID=UPI001C485367|nr:WXG100 family type VII secretion target [Corynebacterium sp. TAE3-ERU12]MBV7294692.1 WXG100 family type VII secretion target [Corynebacterium sp. TAE3-ERU12]
MSDTIRYNFGGIAAGVDDIRGTSARIQGLLDELKARIQPMVATWEGESATAYQDAQHRWDTAAAELNLILESIARVVGEGNDRMADINRQAAASWA